jgi:hypothetical protein
VPFLLKLIIPAVCLAAMLVGVLGVRPEVAVGVTVVIASVILVGFAIVASVFHRQVTVLHQGPAVLMNLVRLQKALQPGKNLFFRFSQRSPPSLRIRPSQLLLTCTCEEAFVQVCLDASFQELPAYRIALAADGSLFWTLSRQGRSDLTLMTLGQGCVRVGDEAFDAVVRVVGPAPLCLAMLDHERRGELLGVLRHHFAPVTLQCDPPVLHLSPRNPDASAGPDPTIHTHLHLTITVLARVLRKLAIADADVATALARGASADACGPVRRRHLEVLLAHFPSSPQAAAALAQAAQDPDPSVRAWLAMREGGDRGFAELSRLLEQEPVGSALGLEIFEHFLGHWPAAQVAGTFETVLRRSTSGDRPKVLGAIMRACDPEKLRCLSSHLNHCDPEEAVAAIRVLGGFSNPLVEAVLLDVIGHPNLTVRQAVVAALGAVGTRRVLPLLFDLGSDRYLGNEAATALRQIQAREKIGDAGQVSLAAPQAEAGQVSVAEPAGGLALVKDEKHDA